MVNCVSSTLSPDLLLAGLLSVCGFTLGAGDLVFLSCSPFLGFHSSSYLSGSLNVFIYPGIGIGIVCAAVVISCEYHKAHCTTLSAALLYVAAVTSNTLGA